MGIFYNMTFIKIIVLKLNKNYILHCTYKKQAFIKTLRIIFMKYVSGIFLVCLQVTHIIYLQIILSSQIFCWRV